MPSTWSFRKKSLAPNFGIEQEYGLCFCIQICILNHNKMSSVTTAEIWYMHQHIFESIKQTKWAKLVLLLISHVKWKDSCSTFLKVHDPKLQLCFLYMLLQHSYSRHCFSLSKKTCNSCFLLIKFNVINLFAHRLFLTITTKNCNILTI